MTCIDALSVCAAQAWRLCVVDLDLIPSMIRVEIKAALFMPTRGGMRERWPLDMGVT